MNIFTPACLWLWMTDTLNPDQNVDLFMVKSSQARGAGLSRRSWPSPGMRTSDCGSLILDWIFSFPFCRFTPFPMPQILKAIPSQAWICGEWCAPPMVVCIVHCADLDPLCFTTFQADTHQPGYALGCIPLEIIGGVSKSLYCVTSSSQTWDLSKFYTAGFSGQNFCTLNFAEFQQLWW